MPGSAPPDRLLAGFLDIYEEAEYAALTALADAVAKKVKKAEKADLVAKATELTALRSRLATITAAMNRRVGRAIPRVLEDAAHFGDDQAVAELDAEFGRNANHSGSINQHALDVLARSLSDTLTVPHMAVTRAVEDGFKQIVGVSVAGMLTGHLTRVEATQRAMDRFAAAGITGFTDRAGRRWQLSTYAEMAVRTAATRAAVDAYTERLVDAGERLAYVSDSPQECGLCRPFEHGIVELVGMHPPRTLTVPHALTGKPMEIETIGSLAYIRAAGFLHPNCTHSISLYRPGVTKLKSYAETANPQGYEDRQQLRALEREVRAAKRQQAAALTPDAAQRAAARVKAGQAAIAAHVKATGLIRQTHREQLVTGDAAAAVTPDRTRTRRETTARRERRRRARARRLAAEQGDQQ